MTPQVITVSESLVAVATNKRCFTFMLLLYHRSWRPRTPSAGYVVFEEISSIGWRLLVYLDGQNRLLVNLFSACIKKRQQAVLGNLVLVVEGFIGLLLGHKHLNLD